MNNGGRAMKAAAKRLLRIDGEVIDADEAAQRLKVTRRHLLKLYDVKRLRTWAELTKH